MTVSDATCYSKTASYVSSNAYYGFVPPSPKSQQLKLGIAMGMKVEVRVGVDERSLNANRVASDTGDGIDDDDDDDDDDEEDAYVAMETDDDEGIHAADHGRRFTANNCFTGFNDLDPLDRHARYFRKRKRNNAGDIIVPGTTQFKKLREGGGNCCGYRGSRSTGERGSGLATVRYRTPPERLITAWNSERLRPPTAAVEICRGAAGTHALPGDQEQNGSLTIGGSKLSESDVEYERMLLETHGCSVYHQHHRQLLQNGTADAEF